MDKDVLLKLIELGGGIITLCTTALVTTRYWFHCRAKESEERAKIFGELAKNFGRDVERLNMATHDLGVRIDGIGPGVAELMGKMAVIEPELSELRKQIPPLMEIMRKVQSYFDRKGGGASIVKPITESIVRVEEVKKENKS